MSVYVRPHDVHSVPKSMPSLQSHRDTVQQRPGDSRGQALSLASGAGNLRLLSYRVNLENQTAFWRPL